MLTGEVVVPRSHLECREEILSTVFPAFGDASSKGNSAAVYVVTHQSSGITQGLVISKFWLAKKGLTTPRLELVAGHMATNLVDNVKEALQGFPIRSVYGWLDSSGALHWIKGGGNYKQFVGNRVRKIQDKNYIRWRHVGTTNNPADLGTRCGHLFETKDLWWRGHLWLAHQQQWPPDIVTSPTGETQAEATLIREVLAVTIKTNDGYGQLMRKWDLWTTIRDGSWVSRFIRNCRAKQQQSITGPITTQETNRQMKFWEKRTQVRCQGTSMFQEDQESLNL